MLHQAKFIIIQTVLLAGIAVLWFFGLLSKPFTGANGLLCGFIFAVGILALLCILFRRFADAEWLAVHVIRLGLLGTVIGLIMAFSVVGGSNFDAESIRAVISSIISGMYVALYATLAGVGVNLWIKINIKLLA
jgi:hypothetical protein